MALHRSFDGSDPQRPVGHSDATVQERRATRTWLLATGTLACPTCDAPVAPTARTMAPRDDLSCPFCAHAGALRDFLSLDTPARPARVEIRIVGTERAYLAPRA